LKRVSLRNQRGASLVEFALIMPLLVLLILGIVDAGWAFFQNLEVRHGAREAARLAAVDYGTADEIIVATCQRMNVAHGSEDFTVALSKSGSDIGDTATVTVSKPDHTSLTGILPFFDHLNLSTTVEIRIEQPAGWSSPAAKTCKDAGW
jgi:Flp pilus assembly pilin Flp